MWIEVGWAKGLGFRGFGHIEPKAGFGMFIRPDETAGNIRNDCRTRQKLLPTLGMGELNTSTRALRYLDV